MYNLDDKEFDNLVALICENILGTGTIVFSDGKDGGRDALSLATGEAQIHLAQDRNRGNATGAEAVKVVVRGAGYQ